MGSVAFAMEPTLIQLRIAWQQLEIGAQQIGGGNQVVGVAP